MNKTFYVQYNVGHAKYVVNHHDGVKRHPDGSIFFDATIFKNKEKLSKFLAGLRKSGYSERATA
jgi:hypothetical protein